MIDKIQLGKWTIRTAASLRAILLKSKEQLDFKKSNTTYWKLVGVYDTRIFGLVFYRNGELKEFYPEKSIRKVTFKNDFLTQN